MIRKHGEDSMRASLAILSAVLLCTASVAAQQRTTLDIYVTDVEGGNATLFVTPAGESVLIDTGNLNGAVRDVGRIMDAVRDSGLTQIDHLILTHYHADHFGGMEELSKRIPIREFIDQTGRIATLIFLICALSRFRYARCALAWACASCARIAFIRSRASAVF